MLNIILQMPANVHLTTIRGVNTSANLANKNLPAYLTNKVAHKWSLPANGRFPRNILTEDTCSTSS